MKSPQSNLSGGEAIETFDWKHPEAEDNFQSKCDQENSEFKLNGDQQKVGLSASSNKKADKRETPRKQEKNEPSLKTRKEVQA